MLNNSCFDSGVSKKWLILTVIILSVPAIMFAWADWQSVSNQHFKIYFKKGWDEEARQAMKTMEYYRPGLEKLTGGNQQQIPITIEDLGNVVNGYTDPFKTRIALFAYTPTTDELAVCENWWQLVGCHEYIHMLQLTREQGVTKFMRMGFSNYLYPEMWQPGWMTEGITVYGESQLSPYTGRLNGGTFHSIIASLAKQNKIPSPTKASYNSFDTPQANIYTFGGAFFEYLATTYGEDKFSSLYKITSSSLLAYLNGFLPLANLDVAFQEIYGKYPGELWLEWISYERQKPYNMPKRSLTSDGWFKSNLQVADNKLYYIAGKADKTGPNSSFFTYRLYRVDVPQSTVMKDKMPNQVFPNSSAEPKILIEQNTDFPAGYCIMDEYLYYSRTELHKDYSNSEMDGYGGDVQIFRQNTRDGKREKLYQGQVRAFSPMSDGTILVSEDNELHTASTLFKIKPHQKASIPLYTSNALIHTILVNEDKLILGIKNPWQNCSIVSLDLSGNKLEPIIKTPYFTTPVSINGDTLVFNAVFDGKTGAYVYNMRDRYCYRLCDLDDIRTPVLLSNDKVFFISLNSGGYDIYQDNLTRVPYALPNDDIPGAPYLKGESQVELAIKRLPTGRFKTYMSNLGHMVVPRLMHIPIIEGTGDSIAVGVMLSGNDVVNDFPFWSANVFYDTKFDKIKYYLALENNFFRPLKQTIGYSNDDEQSFSTIQNITLHKQVNYGLQTVNLGFSFLTKEDYHRKVWTPYFDMSFGWATGSLLARQFVPYETKTFLPSDRTRTGWQSYFQYHQRLPLCSELKVAANIADDRKADNDEVFGTIRGYDESFETNRGAIIQASIYKPIIKIREGLWNPQIYAEDVHLGLFCDAAIPNPMNEALRQSSTGLEILTEVSMAYYLKMSLGIRFVYNKDKEYGSQFFVDTLF